LGLDAREWTPLLTQRIVYAAAETRSFARAAVVLQQVGGNAVSPNTIQRITHAVGTCDDAAAGWSRYLALARACWQGRVNEVIAELQGWLTQQGIDDAHPLAEDDPRCAAADAVRYLTNNRARMDYPRYRRQGLPTTSALMESLVKEINYRVKGTEMFWNDPRGAEAILQVRAAALCDDDRLARHLATRPGCSQARRPLAAAI
jgi:hypothetical protein